MTDQEKINILIDALQEANKELLLLADGTDEFAGVLRRIYHALAQAEKGASV